MNAEQWDVLEKAVRHFGEENQLIKTMQEMAELQVELTRALEPNGDRYKFENMVEEIVDTMIMLWQTMIIFEIFPDDLEPVFESKIKRLEARINESQIGEEDQKEHPVDEESVGGAVIDGNPFLEPVATYSVRMDGGEGEII